MREDRPAGFHDREQVHLGDRDDLEQAWSAFVQRERLFHEQLRANGEGAQRALMAAGYPRRSAVFLVSTAPALVRTRYAH